MVESSEFGVPSRLGVAGPDRPAKHGGTAVSSVKAAWNLKAWFALLVPERAAGLELLKMEFRSFLQAIVQLPCQIVRTSRRVIWRILSYNRWLKDFFATFERIAGSSGG